MGKFIFWRLMARWR